MEEIMNCATEGMETEIIEIDGRNSGISTGMAMLIGAGMTLAATAAVKLVKKAWAKHKAKKEQQIEEGDFVEVTDEQIV